MSERSRLEKPMRPRAEDLIEEGSQSGIEEDDSFEGFAGDDGSSPSILETGEGGDILSEDDDDVTGASSDEDGESQLKSVSFGTLAKAQADLSRKRKRDSKNNQDQEQKLNALRARLQEIRKAKSQNSKPAKSKSGKTSKAEAAVGSDPELPGESGDSDDSEDGNGPSRSSKHAPMSQSSRYQVSRRREVVEAPRARVRDPRFGPSNPGIPVPRDPSRTDRAYSFLHDYEDSEMAELRTAMKKSKSEGEKETLRRKLMSMENRKKTRLAKEREQEVVRQHRKEERKKVEDGKNPYYLKRGDIKREAEEKRLGSMKKGDKAKAAVRKQKREGQREMKAMPRARRIA